MRYYSPEGNLEEWQEKPEGYYTVNEWIALHPAPEPIYIPTVDEQIAELDAQYDRDKADIMNYYTQAVFAGDEEEQAALKQEMAEIDAQYAEDRKAIKGAD